MPADPERAFAKCGPRVALLNPTDEKRAKFQCQICEGMYHGRKTMAMMVCHAGQDCPTHYHDTSLVPR
eukprot:12905483-Prorocentrum_lima.AAC.1